MTKSLNLATLHSGGYKAQAQREAENLSIWTEQNWKDESTLFGFADGSAIYTCGPEFREATPSEIMAAA